MGNCDSTSSFSDSDLKNRNQKINLQLEQDKRRDESVIKLLLLGTGESGKSTVLKQMKIIHDHGFTESEALQRKSMVYANVLQSMGAILSAMNDLKIYLDSKERETDARLILEVLSRKEETEPMSERMFEAVRNLWADTGVNKAFSRRTEYQLNDSAQYFLDSLDRIHEKNYLPSEQDILHTRVATMGVIEVSFQMKNREWRVFDVGGQRSQRKKWIHCFDDAKAVIFVCALSEYDQVLREDSTTNRMQESLQLFKQVCNNKFFVNTNMIAFLNKKDLFKEKIGSRSLKIAFPEYNGSETYEACSKFIEQKFHEANQVPNKIIYTHQTCATDTGQVQFVLDSVLDTILSNKLKGCGLY
uniref:Guanine nucleotide-binding protein alpha-1 subunit n=1 Tax=Plectus sambesii TaxID=2011161 RepID=A0A914W015_9BILA